MMTMTTRVLALFALFAGANAFGLRAASAGSLHGPETATFEGLPACNKGPHTVRFRHLVSRANNRRLVVTAGAADQAATSSPVHFLEPYRFDDRDVHTWEYSSTVLVDMPGGAAPRVSLGSEVPMSPGGGPTPAAESNPELESLDEWEGVGEAWPREEAEEAEAEAEELYFSRNDEKAKELMAQTSGEEARLANEGGAHVPMGTTAPAVTDTEDYTDIAATDDADAQQGGGGGEGDDAAVESTSEQRRRRRMLSSSDAQTLARDGAHILTHEERVWLEEAVGGTDMSEPVVLYNTQRDDDPSAQTLLSQLNDRVISRDAHGGIKEMVVLVAQIGRAHV